MRNGHGFAANIGMRAQSWADLAANKPPQRESVDRPGSSALKNSVNRGLTWDKSATRYNVLKHIYTDPCRNLLDLHIPEHVWNCSLFRRPQFCS